MSSHLLADLERVCDHIVILASGETQLCDDIENVLISHKLLVGKRQDTANDEYTIIQQTDTPKETSLLVRLNNAKFHNSRWHIRDVDMEEIVLAYMGQSREKIDIKATKGVKL